MRNYTAESYKDLVEDIDDNTLQRFMRDEQGFIAGVADIKSKTLVDLGAGYGRVVPYLSSIARDVVAVEINTDMYPELERRAKGLPNVMPIHGDFLKLPSILPDGIKQPVFLILQNSIGTIEGGDAEHTLEVVRKEAASYGGSIILSLLRQQALQGWGVSMYGKLHDMVGIVDLEKSDFDSGLMVTDTGYTSKWWTDSDIAGFQKLGSVVRELHTDEYQLLEITV